MMMRPLYSIIQKMKKKTAILPLSYIWLLHVFWVKALKLFPSTKSWNWYTFLYTILQCNKSFWTQIFRSGNLNINIMN